MSFIEVKNVHYRKNSHEIFSDLNFSLGKGRIVALLGENGSGKTTIMRLLSGLALNWKGQMSIDGTIIGDETKSKVSYIVNLNDFPKDFTISKVLDFYRRFYADYSSERAEELLNFMEINPQSKLKTLSRGQLEKAALVATLARKTEIYLLDEPLSGIDLLTREKIIQSLIRWFDEKSLILLTTHQMTEIENIVDEVMILKNRQIIQHQDMELLRETRGIGLENLYREALTQ
ncbi:ATP-binding cassette domain-containing protein [Enterococcus sp. AZ072]|uniref:ATP-binding cassette domain-containing protein n=1 Tax=unclassified Enterococcus TaxID=2608891 RepID=UPI003D26CAFE